MSFEKPKAQRTEAPVDRNKTLSDLNGILNEVMNMGANDVEHSQFDSIFKRLQKGEITDIEAVTEALAIRDGKNAYH
jgi:hypothetical protein